MNRRMKGLPLPTNFVNEVIHINTKSGNIYPCFHQDSNRKSQVYKPCLHSLEIVQWNFVSEGSSVMFQFTEWSFINDE